ncbi:MAG: toll/interleukin-1 receptor domain-containing protein [Luteolibacter sp.]
MSQPKPPSPTGGWVVSLKALLFGYDFFISYAQEDATRAYGEVLQSMLEERDYVCFRDTKSLHAGDKLTLRISWCLWRTRCLIVLGTERALESEWVSREIGMFSKRRRRIVPLDLQQIRTRQKWPAFEDMLFVDDSLPKPSARVVDQIASSLVGWRANRVARLVLASTATMMALLLIGTLVFFWRYRTEARRGLETLATMVFQQAHEDVNAGRFNEAAVRLSEAARLVPEAIVPSARLSALMHETSHFERVEGECRHLADGVILDAVFHTARNELLCAVAETGGLAIYGGRSTAAVARWSPDPGRVIVHVRLSSGSDRVVIWLTLPEGAAGSAEVASFRISNTGSLEKEAPMPDSNSDVCFLRDGTILGGDATEIHHYKLAGDSASATWREKSPPRKWLPQSANAEDTDSVEFQRMGLSPSEKLVFIVAEMRNWDDPRDSLLAFELEGMKRVGGDLNGGDGDKIYGFDTLSIDGTEYVAVARDGRYRNKNRYGSAQVFSLNGHEWLKEGDPIVSIEGVNDIAMISRELVGFATDRASIHLAAASWADDAKWMHIASEGSIRKVVAGSDGDIWLLKAPDPVNSLDHEGTFVPITCEHWQRKKRAAFATENLAAFPDKFPPSVSAYAPDMVDKATQMIMPRSRDLMEIKDSQLLRNGTPESAVNLRRFGSQVPICMSASTRGDFIAIGGGEDPRNDEAGYAMVWKTRPMAAFSPAMTHRGCVLGVCLSGDGLILATVSRESPPAEAPPTHLQLWDVRTGRPLCEPIRLAELLKLPPDEFAEGMRLCFSADQRSLIVQRLSFDNPPPSPMVVSFKFAPADRTDEIETLRSTAAAASGLYLTDYGSIEAIPSGR